MLNYTAHKMHLSSQYYCVTIILKVAPYNFSKKLSGTLVYNIFRQIYYVDESKQLIMIDQRLEFTKRQGTILKLTLL